MGTYDSLDLFLVRHGVTEWNQQKRYLGHTDCGVIKEELIHSTQLKEQLQQMNFDLVVTSDLRRCQETLAFLSLSKSAKIDKRLREMNFGDWEGKTYEQLKESPTYRKWISNWETNDIPNGESGAAFKHRIDSFISELLEQASLKTSQKVLIVSHGGVIRYIVSKFKPTQPFWEIPIKHGKGIKLSLVRKSGDWQCSSLSEELTAENETL